MNRRKSGVTLVLPSGSDKTVEKVKQGGKKGNRLSRRHLVASAELNCKLVDFGNACWTYKQFTSDIQTR
ncbi:hypothetical protein Bca52824_008541 [Brassica carinata]|uniref:non-specific serine/threonine protein kinase n=1 Tax=Brassica carinata TaxID=52824 RepID=A0A8X7WC83_BRACI|nr:hypothetical protein Bca52824_008541 [Brassica carinata]